MQMNHYTNKKSLALLGHGKWKSALGHTLLLIGMVLVSLGAFAQEPTNGLYMHKTWIPDETDPTGSKGEIMLETFVTGEKIKTEAHIPTDIVIVVDQSGSMAYNFDGTQTQNVPLANQRVTALKNALNTFLTTIQQDAVDNNCDHRIAIVGFGTAPAGNQTTWTNTELLTPTEVNYNNAGTQNYKNALVYVNNNGSVNNVLTNAVSNISANGGTMMQYGLMMANSILSNRDITTFDPGNGEEMPRTQVVIFFTDGYPGLNNPNNRFAQYRNTATNTTQNYICQTVADATVVQSRNLKNNGAIIYSVGIFGGANPSAAYITTRKNTTGTGSYYYWEPQTTPTSGQSGDAAANGLMHFISSNYSPADLGTGTDPWTTHTTSNLNVAGYKNDGKYLSASNAGDLANIFESIASESGGAAVDLGAGTVVQDVISPSFQLNIPTGSTPGATIRAYAPKCNGKVGGVFTFEDPTDGATRMTLGTVDGVEGMVIGNDENRLEDGIVDYDEDSKTLTFSNFNFKAMYVAQEVDDDGNPVYDDDDNPIFFGRKLQMFIPLEVDGGSWGDGILTNGPLSVIQPNGDTINTLPFNIPTANVLGSVWTEVITEKPEGFPEVTGDGSGQTVDIDSPEDLAWFISEVNGRVGYTHNNTVASHPKLNGRLTADIDMSAHNWVPIGCGNQVETYVEDGVTMTRYIENNGQRVHMVYEGTFDGNGHVVTGLKNNASKYYKLIEGDEKNVVVFPGMFSDVSGTIKNLFVLDADFRGKHHNEHFVHHGIIADTLETTGLIFNCEAAGRITCNNDPKYADPANDSKLVFGGLVGLNRGTIHSCMAMAELTGYTMGGMIGRNEGSFSNGFTNGVYNYLDNGITGKYTGGIAAENTGTITNCYVRFERDNQNLNKVIFGQITGTAATYTKSYSPEDLAGKVPASSTAGTMTYKHAEPAQWARPFYHDATLGETRTALLDQLNADKGTGAKWKRTTAGGYLRSPNGGNINGDYPVLAFDVFGTDSITCLGSADGIRVDYATSLLDMLYRHNNGNMNDSTHISNEYTVKNPDFYKVTEHEAIYKGTINLYRNDDITIEESNGKEGIANNCTANGVVVYIDENVSLLQDENSVVKAFTGQSIKVFGGQYGQVQEGNRWHNVSSSLEDSGFGWTYANNDQVPHSTAANPCGWRLDQTNDDVDIFPTDLGTYHQSDFYCFYEPQYHWINFRRNGKSHWHMDLINDAIGYDVPSNHAHIDYVNELGVQDNETQFIPGKGYLLAFNASAFDSVEYRGSQFLQNYGTLNHADISIKVSADAPEWTGLKGYNLLGNPYQSYLDFEEFKTVNSSLWDGEAYANTYAVYDPKSDAWLQYAAQASDDAEVASQYINMHQGFMIRVSKGGKAQFTNAMRTNDGTPNFRGKQNYPLINFMLDNGQDSKNVAVLELGRPENGGAEKLNVGSTKGRISLRHDNQDFGVLFRDITEGSQPLYFDTDEDGTFTLSWNTANADFSSLTLVDNLTGVKYDMLANDHYTFQGNASDYRARFKVVIGRFTGIDEEDGPSTGSGTFAFYDGSDWVVNGQGQLTVTDMTGRTVYSSNLTNDQNRVSLNGVANGIYLMRVANGQNVNVQKIIIK